MRRECPICGAPLTRHGVSSTKFEQSSAILCCNDCDYESPEEGSDFEWERAQAERAPAQWAAAQLRELQVATRVDCPFCSESLNYRVKEEYVACGTCCYQEHWPRAHALGLLSG